MKTRVCPSCGKENSHTTWSCIECGETLSINTIADTEIAQLSSTSQEMPNDTTQDYPENADVLSLDHSIPNLKPKPRKKRYVLSKATLVVPAIAWMTHVGYIATVNAILATTDSGYEAIGTLAGIALIFPISGIYLGHVAGLIIGITGVIRKIYKHFIKDSEPQQNIFKEPKGERLSNVLLVIGVTLNTLALIALLIFGKDIYLSPFFGQIGILYNWSLSL